MMTLPLSVLPVRCSGGQGAVVDVLIPSFALFKYDLMGCHVTSCDIM